MGPLWSQSTENLAHLDGSDSTWIASDGTTGLTSNLPIVIINTNGVEIPDEPKITGHMGIIDNGPGNTNNQFDPPNEYDGQIGIEIRGQSAQMFPKKSYGFETRDETGEDLDVSLLGMPEESDWVLYAPYSDKSMLRNFISFYMGSKLDPYCTRMAYCEVIVNDDYKGVYILMERIKRDKNRVDIARLNPDEITGDDLTGGYIVRVDKIDEDFVLGTDGWRSYPDPPYPEAMKIIYQYFYPKAEDIVPEQKEYIQDFIGSCETSLTRGNFADPDEGYNKFLNTPSFVDQMILCEISKEVDKYRYSTYFYKDKDSKGGKLFAGPAWDFNLGYANVDFWPPGTEYQGWMYPMVEPVEWGIMFWWKRLMEDDYFADLFYTRWQQLRQGALSNAELEKAIDSIVGYIDEAQQRNYERWPILGEYVWPNYDWAGNDYDDEVAFLEDWMFNRIAWIDDNISGSIRYPSATLSTSSSELNIRLSDEYFNTKILDSEYFILNNAPQGINIESVTYRSASRARIMLTGTLNERNTTQVSVTIKAEILNGYGDVTTNEVPLSSDFEQLITPQVTLYTNHNTLHMKCSQPNLLGDQLMLYSVSGKLIWAKQIAQQQLNSFQVNIIPGVYFCRYRLDGIIQTRKVVITH